MSGRQDKARRRELLSRATQGGVVLSKGAHGAGGPVRVRNPGTGRVLPCCWDDCQRDGDDRIQIRTAHTQPRYDGEQLVYIYCSERHRDYHIEAIRKHRMENANIRPSLTDS